MEEVKNIPSTTSGKLYPGLPRFEEGWEPLRPEKLTLPKEENLFPEQNTPNYLKIYNAMTSQAVVRAAVEQLKAELL